MQHVNKLQEGQPNLLDYMIDGEIQLIMNTPSGKGARTDEGRIRAAAVARGVPCITTIQAADAAVRAMEALRNEEITVQALQDRFESLVSAQQVRRFAVQSVTPCMELAVWHRLAILAKARVAGRSRRHRHLGPLWPGGISSSGSTRPRFPGARWPSTRWAALLFGVVWSLAEERMLISTQTRTIVLVGFIGAVHHVLDLRL